MEKTLFEPLTGDEMPRFAGPGTMMRLPLKESAQGLDACFVGVPFDNTTSNRAGTRFGPRQVRGESAMIKPSNPATHTAPFENMTIADVGDVPINPYNPTASFKIIEESFDQIVRHDCRPLAIGGDHAVTYPILKAMHKKYGPVGMIQVDAHADFNDTMFGESVTHGTWSRRAVDDGLLDCDRVVQIGLRGSSVGPYDFDMGRKAGFRAVQAEECWYKSLAPLMEEVRAQMGDAPVYITFDIDGIDQAEVPGTGSPEMGGLTSIQALEIIRGCKGLNIVGADLVEISPPYDPSGNTALLGANLLFEMLCILPKASG